MFNVSIISIDCFPNAVDYCSPKVDCVLVDHELMPKCTFFCRENVFTAKTSKQPTLTSDECVVRSNSSLEDNYMVILLT